MHEMATTYDDVTLDERRSRLLPALVCGALTGFSLGILLAPSRGAVTRRRLASAARAGYDRTSRLVTRASRLARRGRRAATTHAGTVAAFVDRTRRRVQAGSDEVAESVRAATDVIASGRRTRAGD